MLLLVCLKLNWVRKGMVQYKLFLGSLKSDSFFIIGKYCLCSNASVLLFNGLLCWHLSLFTCMPCAVYIFLKHYSQVNSNYNTWHPVKRFHISSHLFLSIFTNIYWALYYKQQLYWIIGRKNRFKIHLFNKCLSTI